jgi:hypothetical protein
MIKTGISTAMLLVFLFILTAPGQSRAEPPIHIEVKTILASQEAGGIDPNLRNLTKDLKSVFRYSSYKLIGQNNLSLNLNKPGKVSLPGNRKMTITPEGISGGRATLKLEIYSGKRKNFQTIIRLRNKSSITVGGPKFRGGFLLFNIYNSF